ncbi:MAG: hypothetical protein AAF193_09420, partial [Bacteroidota bacterium]
MPVPPVAVSGQVEGEVYDLNLLEDPITGRMPYIRLEIDGNQVNTDDDATFLTNVDGPVSLDMALEGDFCTIFTQGTTPEFSGTIQDGYNFVNDDSWTNIKERTTYRATNLIHDHMKSWLPNFTGLDFSLTTNIDVEGECNAFYDGSSINFFDAGGGCNATSLIADVVYHEYGHGINDFYYQSFGANFINGAMNEGYADLWAISLTENNGLLGVGFNEGDDEPLRRYDIDPKIYPQDLVGQVHNDGEIICGAWYETHLLMGENWDQTMEIFIGAYDGLQATAMNGNEGSAYGDVLLDALQADDDDADITNGTPNGGAIVEGFATHGITLLSAIELEHDALTESTPEEEIELIAEADIVFPFTLYFDQAEAHYRILPDTEWQL